MKFHVADSALALTQTFTSTWVLLQDGWDDWFRFSTMYILFHFDEKGERKRIGELKIGQFNMSDEQRSPELPKEFTELSEKFFSIGQDESYYENLTEMGGEISQSVLVALRDFAFDTEIFHKAQKEDVTGVSLMRSVPRATILGQFARMSRGGARITKYKFSYKMPAPPRALDSPVIDFEVLPESNPPTNIHVLVGRNGVGKTYCLNAMTQALAVSENEKNGKFDFEDDPFSLEGHLEFSTIVSVTFSAFDPFEPLPIKRNQAGGIQYHYVGLKWQTKDREGKIRPPKSPDELQTDFLSSLGKVMSKVPTRERWARAIKLLESDPVFARVDLWRLTAIYTEALKHWSKQVRAMAWTQSQY